MSGKVVEQIKAKLALTDKVGERVKLRRSGKTLLGLCPFHDERTPSFVVYPEEGTYHCFGCQAHGDVIDFVARSRGIEVRDAIAELAREAGIDYRPRDDEQCARLYAANAEAAALFAAALEQDPDAAACREYVQARGIGADMVRELGLGYAPRQAGALAQALARRDLVEAGIRAGLLRRDRPEEQPRAAFWGRLMFPVRDLDRRVIAFGARALDQRVPKYINSPESVLYSKSRGLYGIDRAAQAARDQHSIIVVEGYIDAITLWQAGIKNVLAACGTALTVHHIKLLRRLAPEIIVTFDGDEAGRAAMLKAAETLIAAGMDGTAAFLPDGHDPDTYVRAQGAAAFLELVRKACPILDCKLLTLGAMTDRVAAVREAARLVASCADAAQRAVLEARAAEALRITSAAMREAVQALRKRTRIEEAEIDRLALQDDSRSAISNGSTATPIASAALEGWPDPSTVVSVALPPVPAFDYRLLPEAMRGWIADIAERAQCPPDYPAVGAIVAASSLVGRQLGIRPKGHDDWLVVPNLWGMIVGPPGLLKTPMLAEALRPIRRLEAGAHEEFCQRMRQYEIEHGALQARRKALQDQMVSAFKKNLDIDGLKAQLNNLCDQPPVERRYIVNDPTVEKLGELLNQNPRGLLLFRDELIGFLATMERSGHEGDRGFYLESWTGSGSYVYDRISRGTIRVEAACISILGAITPGPLNAYLRESFEGARDDGFVQRYQVSVYPDPPRAWRNVDRYPDSPARQRAYEFFERLDSLRIEADPDSDSEIPSVRFLPEAQELFDAWRTDLEAMLRREDGHPVIVAHLAKYRSLLPSLALVFHLADSTSEGGKSPVSLEATSRAAAWCDYLLAHARRIYAPVIDRARAAAVALGEKVRDASLRNPFTARDIDRAGWSGLTNPGDVRGAIDILERAGWIRRDRIKAEGPGRPRERLWINPKLQMLGTHPPAEELRPEDARVEPEEWPVN